MTSCIVGKKIRAMGPGPLELFPFVVVAIKFCVKDISGTTLPRNLKFCTHDKYDQLYCGKENKGHGARSLKSYFHLLFLLLNFVFFLIISIPVFRFK